MERITVQICAGTITARLAMAAGIRVKRKELLTTHDSLASLVEPSQELPEFNLNVIRERTHMTAPIISSYSLSIAGSLSQVVSSMRWRSLALR